MKRIGFILPFVILLVFGLLLFILNKQNNSARSITSYDACVAAGYPVRESYPPACTTPDGRSFTQDIGNELEFRDVIIIDHPRPNQKITSPLKITGKARGIWFFEANFPIELYDANDRMVGSAIAFAKGEWMTEEFVTFEATLTFAKPQTTNGKLIIRNANPSGLPENEKVLTLPIGF